MFHPCESVAKNRKDNPVIQNFKELIAKARQISQAGERPIKVALAAGHDLAALTALIAAQKSGIAQGILIGETEKIQRTLETVPEQPQVPFEIINAVGDAEIAKETIRLVKAGQAEIVMKGKIKTGTLLKAALDKSAGLRTGRLISDVTLFELPNREHNQLIMVTDGGINLSPDLSQKAQLIENAVQVAHALENELPKVAVLSAVEVVNPDLPSTIDAAILSKMNQRGQITGCLVEGPLALDNAVSPEAARLKQIESPVAGYADILLCPNLESANILAKSATYFAGLPLAHTCVGAKAPVLIPSRSDSADAKFLSIALSVVVTHFIQRR
ncbi:MAG: bifunctional enoyl-CoA hydratase/phosphate acetyltransferase [Methanosarcinaceae archaeon]